LDKHHDNLAATLIVAFVSRLVASNPTHRHGKSDGLGRRNVIWVLSVQEIQAAWWVSLSAASPILPVV
jgi:hypothetical protein